MSRVTDSQKIQKELELRIIKGFYRENSPMPSTMEVHDEFHIGLSTVQQIYAEMKNEGTIYAKQGKGTWVSPYCTVKLRKKHVNHLRNEIYALREYAEEIGLDFLEEVNLVLTSGAADS